LLGQKDVMMPFCSRASTRDFTIFAVRPRSLTSACSSAGACLMRLMMVSSSSWSVTIWFMVGLGVNKTTRAFVNKGGSVFSPKMGDRGRPRFWANERERSRVNRYIDRHPALDRNNEEHKIKVRDMLRRQDALRVEQLSGGRASARLEETPEGKAVVALLRTEQPYGRIEVADRDRRLIGQEPPPLPPSLQTGPVPRGFPLLPPGIWLQSGPSKN
jgi:hypothetical protein